jgi:hypothetical protein
MGIQIPQIKKTGAKKRVVITFTGRLSEDNAKALKKELDRVLDRYRDKCGGITPAKRRSKGQMSS